MRPAFKILCVLLLVIGGLTLMFGLFALFTAKLVVQPPPSMNEGPALLGFIGLVATTVGGVLVLLGVSTRAGLRVGRQPDSEPKPDWLREHKRLW
ncbi:MAG TPA: hypothetical protein VHM25_11465 [Polyangiaceae bacterium]|jgi:hypothetical protein|nr:hypothetical protein [Polyangiaceae bacterium]